MGIGQKVTLSKMNYYKKVKSIFLIQLQLKSLNLIIRKSNLSVKKKQILFEKEKLKKMILS